MSAPLLEVREIHTAYGLSRVLFGVSIEVGAGECVCLLGRNGVGKSTTMRSIMGLTPPQAGRVAFKGVDITGWESYRVARAGIGFVPEDRRIFADLTVWENLDVAQRGGGWTTERVFDLFPTLRQLTGRNGGYLSGGEQQMLTIARTLMGNPELGPARGDARRALGGHEPEGLPGSRSATPRGSRTSLTVARRFLIGRLWRRLLLLGVLAFGAWLAWEAATWPDVKALATRAPATTAFIERYKERERAADRTPRVEWRWVPYGTISLHLKRAVLVAEDIGFFHHHGFAPGNMRVAMTEALEERKIPRGASTITQQLAKNLWLTPSRSPLRKAREGVLTWQLERALSKRRILELYLNVVEFGPGVYGAEAASRRYFGKPAAELDEDEATQLAASPSAASTAWSPSASSSSTRPPSS
ncbi:MAG: hypothetical protein DMD76_28360 [Candidatus Rokuibacteriota bacterium]|nr:MAG: hypothetical protein DMD76_28360 [Candidatus Rokubacteria bacterium]